tara:strand:+ start:6499 stop:7752 length:1254 start_codon:yes stop_codon:yes gene_type:complete
MFFNKKISIYLILSFTLFFGFLLGENSSGGAKIDHQYLVPFIKNFSINFEDGLEAFLSNSGSLIHSPSFYIIMGFFLNVFENLMSVNILYLIISLLLPFFFFCILKEKFQINNSVVFYISIIIFLSPYFRSSAIWLLNDNLSLIFLSLSILFFVKFDQNKKNNHLIVLSVIFLIICCYIRYYYCVFYLYYFFYFLVNFERKLLFKILFLSFILSIPALVYFYYVIIEFNFIETLDTFGEINYLNSGIIILTIIFFYLFPFLIDKDFTIFNYYKKNIKVILIFVFIFLFLCFIHYFLINDLIKFPQNGGGIFIKLFRFLHINENLSMIFISLISLIALDFLFKKNRILNYFLLCVLIASLPMVTIYQKYLDPLFFLIFFGLVKSDYLNESIIKGKLNLKFIFSYFSSFYLLSLLYYLN